MVYMKKINHFQAAGEAEKAADRQRDSDSVGLTHNCQKSISHILNLNHGSASTHYDQNDMWK